MAERPRLTKAHRDQLTQLAAYAEKMPASWVKRGLPGVPFTNVYTRLIVALHEQGLVECVVHQDPAGVIVPCYALTPSGRLAISGDRDG